MHTWIPIRVNYILKFLKKMGKYIVTSGQNLYDIALHIYGSIEGIVDLLIHNTSLSLTSKLTTGQEVIYTDNFIIDSSVVNYYKRNNIIPANGERNVYYKESLLQRLLDIELRNDATFVMFKINGVGTIDIDWGDNTPIEKISLSYTPQIISHSFDNKIPYNRVIRIYGEDVRFKAIDLTDMNPIGIYVISNLYADKVILHNTGINLNFIHLLQNTYELDLSFSNLYDLMPLLSRMELMKINLSQCKIEPEELDAYLIGLVKRHNERRACTIILDQKPSGEYKEPPRDANNVYDITTGMEAIYVIVNEPAWNEGGNWKFVINEQTYTRT